MVEDIKERSAKTVVLFVCINVLMIEIKNGWRYRREKCENSSDISDYFFEPISPCQFLSDETGTRNFVKKKLAQFVNASWNFLSFKK